MPSRKTPDSPPPLRLAVSEEEARQKLQARIEKGNALRNRAISSHEALKQTVQEQYRWSDFNEQLLLNLFNNNQEILRKYRMISLGGPDYDRYSIEKAVARFREDIDYYLNSLQSILESLELFIEPGR
jgi:chromosome condensin MukBEF MukE localization factor